MVKRRDFHVMQSSMLLTNTDDQYVADLRKVFSREPDVVGVTEVRDRGAAFHEVTDGTPYIPIKQGLGGWYGFYIRKSPDVELKGRGNIKVATYQSLNAMLSCWISWVHLRVKTEHVWAHICHWPPHLNELPKNAGLHAKATRMMAQQCQKHAKGGAISFFMGDLNYDTDNTSGVLRGEQHPATIFKQYGLIPIYTELHKHSPATHGPGGIDIVGVLKKSKHDRTAVGKRVQVWPKGYSDHRALSGFYEIALDKQSGSHGGGGDGGSSGADPPETTPTPGDITGNPVADDFYSTGGNISWADYDDTELYPLPRVIDA